MGVCSPLLLSREVFFSEQPWLLRLIFIIPKDQNRARKQRAAPELTSDLLTFLIGILYINPDSSVSGCTAPLALWPFHLSNPSPAPRPLPGGLPDNACALAPDNRISGTTRIRVKHIRTVWRQTTIKKKPFMMMNIKPYVRTLRYHRLIIAIDVMYP